MRSARRSSPGPAEVDCLAIQAAEDALVASRFTTWASKFAVHEAGLRRRALAGDERSSPATP